MHPGNIHIQFYKENEELNSQEIHRLSSLQNEQLENELLKLNTQGFQPRCVIYDAGLVTELSPINLQNFLDLFVAVAEFDGDKVGQLLIERSKYRDSVTQESTFKSKLRSLLDKFKKDSLVMSNLNVGEILLTVLSAVQAHHVKIEGDFANLAIALALLEGIGKRLNPKMDLLEEALPMLKEASSLDKATAKTATVLYRKVYTRSMISTIFQRNPFVSLNPFE